MAESRPRRECACGESLALFQPRCRDCGRRYEWTYRGPCYECGAQADYLAGRCEGCGSALAVWRALEATAFSDETELTVWREAVPRPTEEGYTLHLGSLHGQWADYRRALDGGDFHIRRFLWTYELHYDEISALDSPTRHLVRHGPPAAVGTGLSVTRRVVDAVTQTGRVAGRTLLAPVTWWSRRLDSE